MHVIFRFILEAVALVIDFHARLSRVPQVERFIFRDLDPDLFVLQGIAGGQLDEDLHELHRRFCYSPFHLLQLQAVFLVGPIAYSVYLEAFRRRTVFHLDLSPFLP